MGVITAKMRCCIMLFYYDLLDSTIGVMSSLFGIVNFIRPFSILLYIYTLFYNVLYFAILTRHFRLLWWCFALLICIWLCKVLYPIVQFYILLRRSSKIGWLSKFLYSVLRSHIMFHLVNRSCIMRTSYRAWHSVEKIRRPSRGMVIVLSHAPISAIRCQNGGQCW